MKKIYRIFLSIIILIFLSRYNPNEVNLNLKKNSSFLEIKKMEIINNHLIKESDITEKLKNIYGINIFSFKRN